MSKNKKPLVSVLVPAYNHEDYVRYAILSVVNQTYGYKNIQLIVADDCSTDNTRTILLELEQKFKFKLIIHEQNAGLCSTLNELIASSKGEFITSIASDDVMVLDRIENQINIMKRNIHIDILAGNFILIDKNGKTLSNYKQQSQESLTVYSFDDIFLKRKPGFAAGTAIYRRDLFTRIGAYDPYYKIEDYYFWLKAAKYNAKIVKCNINFLEYRILSDSVSSDEEFMDYEISKILAQYEDHPKYQIALQNREILNLTKLIFIDKIKVMRRIFKMPRILLNWRIITILIMLMLPSSINKYKFPENYYRNVSI